jgi:outer membrane protein TolC
MSYLLFRFLRTPPLPVAILTILTILAILTCAAVPLAIPAASAQTLAPSLTLAEAQRLALLRSRQLAGSDAAIDAASQLAVAAGQLPDPVLKAGIDNLPVSGADRFKLGSDFMTMRRIGLAQELTAGDKRRLRAQAYTLQAEKERAGQVVLVAGIERDSALAWIELYFARQAAQIVASLLDQARDGVTAAEGAYRAGRGSQAELFEARAAVLAAQDRVSESGQRVRAAATLLSRWTGSEAAALASLPAIDQIDNALDLASLDTRLAHHPDLAVLARQEDIARTEADLAAANRSADWSVEIAFQQRGAAYSNMVSVGLSIPLQWDRKNRQDRALAARLATVDQAKAEREEALRMHAAEIRTLIQEWESTRERHARYRQQLLPLAQERMAAALTAYRGGKGTLAEVLAARRADTDAQLQVNQLQADVARLWARLNFLLPTYSASAHAMVSVNQGAQ